MSSRSKRTYRPRGKQIKLWQVAAVAAVVFIGLWLIMGLLAPALNVSTGGGRIVIDTNNDDVDDVTGDKLVTVNKLLKISVTDFFNGTDGSGTLAIYKSGADQASETLTISNGIATSGKVYQSGQRLDLLYNDGSNSKHWSTNVAVPKMTEGDAQSSTYNYMTKDSFTIGTYTDALTVGSSAINDAGSYNSTLSGNTPTFDYKLTNSVENTGIIESKDPTTGNQWGVYLLVKLSGTGAETISMSTTGGFDDVFMVGTTQYGWIHLTPAELTIWKDSNGAYKYLNNVKCDGSQTVSFDLDFTGYSGTAVTMQITAYAYFDPIYLQEHNGAVQTSAVAIAEQTVTLTV